MILSGIVVPLRALIVGAVGAGIAWCWYNDYRWLSVLAPLGVALLGFIISYFGARRVRTNPVSAVHLMPWRVLVPAVIAAAASAVAIIVTVEVSLPEKTASGLPTPADLKEIVTALSAAITAFLSAAFIDWAGDGSDSRIADWIRTTFYEGFAGLFPAGSTGANLVYSNYVIDGWGPEARIKRAQGIAAELKNPTAPAPEA